MSFSGEPAIGVSALTVRFGEALALSDLSLVAEAGQVTALLGPNGAGKTTLIRTCTDILSPTTGTVQVFGLSPAAACAQGLVGVMPQSTGAWSGIKPLELLRYLSRLYPHPLPVDALADRLGLTAFADTPYRRLSGGQQQAVNLAGAIIGRPQLVILDEPTAGMDPHARHVVWELIEQLRAAGTSVVLSTHLMDEAARLADHIWIIDSGRVALHGTLTELTADDTDLETVFLKHTRMAP